MKYSIILWFLFFALATANLALAQEANGQDYVKKVRVAVCEATEVHRQVEFSAPVTARDSVKLGFAASGRLLTRHVDLGDQVKKGDILGELDAKPFRNQYDAAQAELERINAQLQRAQQHLDRVKGLVAQKAATREELEAAESNYRAAEAARAQAKARKEESARQLEETVLRAPYTATVTDCLLEEGEFATVGQPAFILSGKGLKVEIHVPESLLPFLRKGDEVTLEFPLSNLPTVHGQIDHFSQANLIPGSLYPVVIHFDQLSQAPSRIRPGMSAKVQLSIAESKTLHIPIAAIIDPGANQPSVLTVVDGKIRTTPVSILRIAGGKVAIDADLPNKTTVVIAGHAGLLDGDRVEVLP